MYKHLVLYLWNSQSLGKIQCYKYCYTVEELNRLLELLNKENFLLTEVIDIEVN